jgi:hypothetical protein
VCTQGTQTDGASVNSNLATPGDPSWLSVTLATIQLKCLRFCARGMGTPFVTWARVHQGWYPGFPQKDSGCRSDSSRDLDIMWFTSFEYITTCPFFLWFIRRWFRFPSKTISVVEVPRFQCGYTVVQMASEPQTNRWTLSRPFFLKRKPENADPNRGFRRNICPLKFRRARARFDPAGRARRNNQKSEALNNTSLYSNGVL